MDDSELVSAALSGGPAAFGPIVERYQDAVFGVALARLKDFHEAQDVAQQVFIEAFERIGSLKQPARLGAWLRSIAIHRSIDQLRCRREPAGKEADEAIAQQRHRQGQRQSDLREVVLSALERLTKPQRETVMLFYINGYTAAEVAAIQEVPLGTVKGRLHDARERLKEEMVHMVGDVLHKEAPDEGFGRRVFGLLSRYELPSQPPWSKEWKRIAEEIRRIGGRGMEGFLQAMESVHSPTRVFATRMLQNSQAADEVVVEVFKRCLRDPNRKVRRFAMDALMSLDVEGRRKRDEFLPLVLPLLTDPSGRVRRAVAWRLVNSPDLAAAVPVATVARAVLQEKRAGAKRHYIEAAMRAVIEAQEAPGKR
jgi:RNA polymerase sigma factor (sigma-70 family)